MAKKKDLAKVAFLDSDGQVETLWATALGGHRFCLDNTPFFAYGVSWQDTIEARSDKQVGFPVFKRVVKKSGHRTVRVLLEEGSQVLGTLPVQTSALWAGRMSLVY